MPPSNYVAVGFLEAEEVHSKLVGEEERREIYGEGKEEGMEGGREGGKEGGKTAPLMLTFYGIHIYRWQRGRGRRPWFLLEALLSQGMGDIPPSLPPSLL